MALARPNPSRRTTTITSRRPARGLLSAAGNEQARDLRAVLGEDRLSAIWRRYEKPIVASDGAAPREPGEELGAAYSAAVQEEVARALAAGDLDALLGSTPSVPPHVRRRRIQEQYNSPADMPNASIALDHPSRTRLPRAEGRA